MDISHLIWFFLSSHKTFNNSCNFYQCFKMPSVHVNMCYLFIAMNSVSMWKQRLTRDTYFNLSYKNNRSTSQSLIFMSTFIFKVPCLLEEINLKSQIKMKANVIYNTCHLILTKSSTKMFTSVSTSGVSYNTSHSSR